MYVCMDVMTTETEKMKTIMSFKWNLAHRVRLTVC